MRYAPEVIQLKLQSRASKTRLHSSWSAARIIRHNISTCLPMRLETTRCTSTSASVLKSCANRLLLASSPHFSWTNMDSSRGLDRHSLATWAAASEARSAQPIKPLDRRRWPQAAVTSEFGGHVMPSEENMVQSPCAPRETWERCGRCRDNIGRWRENQSLRRGGDGGGLRVRGRLL